MVSEVHTRTDTSVSLNSSIDFLARSTRKLLQTPKSNEQALYQVQQKLVPCRLIDVGNSTQELKVGNDSKMIEMAEIAILLK